MEWLRPAPPFPIVHPPRKGRVVERVAGSRHEAETRCGTVRRALTVKADGLNIEP
jgi:hypothetical protein